MNSLSTPSESHTMTDDSNPNSDLSSDGRLPSVLVRASAGTGKTYRLTGRLLKILLRGGAPESILATTFTRKAAGEILDRVLMTLAKSATDPKEIEELRKQVGIDTLPPSVCLQLIHRLVANIHRLRICTLDSLFTQLAKSFPFELRLPPAWRLTDEIEEQWLTERATNAVVASLDPAELTTMLSMLGKGDAKRSVTRELLEVVTNAYSIQRQCSRDVWKKLDVPKAPESSEITRAAGMLATAEAPQKTIRARLQEIADCLERREFDGLAEKTLVQNIVKARKADDVVKFGRSKMPDGIDSYLDVFYAAVKTAALGKLAAQNEATGEILAAFDFRIGELKQSLRVLSFDDVAVRLANVFSSVDAETLTRRMDGAIDHVLLDEFQDTSPAQWQVLRPLAMRVASDELEKAPESHQDADESSTLRRSFFCVGDTKQAIYGWRGGVAEIFDAVSDQIPGVVGNEQNESYRSSPVIMDFVNDVFPNLKRHPITDAAKKKDPADNDMHEARAILRFARSFPKHVANKSKLPGYVRFETGPAIEGDAAAKRLPNYLRAAKCIADLNARNSDLEIAVLTRTNATVGQMIFLLEKMGVDASQEGGNPLTDSPAVEMVLSALMFAEHPGDKRWWYHIRTTPIGQIDGISPSMIRRLLDDFGVAETVRRFADSLAFVCDDRDTLRLRQLTQLALQYESNATSRVRDFVRMVREKKIERAQPAPVRVMTIHKSKGLEFDAVVLPEIDGGLSGRPPSCIAEIPDVTQPPKAMTRYLKRESRHILTPAWQRAFGNHSAGRITEQLCLMYVALTRAKQAVFLFTPPVKEDHKSAAGLIYQALKCENSLSDPDQLLYESGDKNWFEPGK